MGEPHRESCRREHRVVGHYLAVQSWIRGLDCIVLVRHDLEVLFGLERFKSARIQWLKEDLKPWFPHQEFYYLTKSMSSIRSIFLSRVPIVSHLPNGSMTTELRIAKMSKHAPKTQRFTDGENKNDVPTEKDIVSFLAHLNSGLIDPSVYSSE